MAPCQARLSRNTPAPALAPTRVERRIHSGSSGSSGGLGTRPMGAGNLAHRAVLPGEVAHQEVDRDVRRGALEDQADRGGIEFVRTRKRAQADADALGLPAPRRSDAEIVAGVGVQALVLDGAGQAQIAAGAAHKIVGGAEDAGEDRRGGRQVDHRRPYRIVAAVRGWPRRCRRSSGAAAGRSRSRICGRLRPRSRGSGAARGRKPRARPPGAPDRANCSPPRSRRGGRCGWRVRPRAARRFPIPRCRSCRAGGRARLPPRDGRRRGTRGARGSMRPDARSGITGRPWSSVVSFGGVTAHQPTFVSPKIFRSSSSRIAESPHTARQHSAPETVRQESFWRGAAPAP